LDANETAAEADGAGEDLPDEEEDEEEDEKEEPEEEELTDIEVAAPMALKRPASDVHTNLDGYMVVFNAELMLAKRFLPGKEAEAELSRPLDAKSGETDALVQAVFLSGTWSVPGLTYRRLQSMRGERGAQASGTGKLWEQTHVASSHAIFISQRVDRFLLLSVFEQTKQRLQVRLDKFGPVQDQHAQEPLDSLTLQRGLAFLTPIAKSYADNLVELKDLKKARDDQLLKDKVAAAPRSQVRASALKKRPAAALDSAIASKDEDVEHGAKQPCIKEGLAASATLSSTGASSSMSRSAPCASSTACNKRYVEYEELPDVPQSMVEHFLEL
jgi:hypothetical protein